MRQNILIFIFFITNYFSFVSFSFAQQENQNAAIAAELLQNKEYEKAAELYEGLYQNKPQNYYYTAYLTCLIQIKDYSSAKKLIKKHSKANPQHLSYQVDMGNIYQLEGNTKDAKKIFDQTLKQITNSELQVLSLSQAFINNNLSDYAIETLIIGRELSKNNSAYSLELANLYQQKANHIAMLQEYINLLQSKPESKETIQNKLQDFLINDPNNLKSELIQKTLLKAIQKNSDNLTLYEILIWLAIQKKDFETAYIQTKALDKQFNEDGYRILQLAHTAAKEESYPAASKCYQFITEKGENNPYYYEALIGKAEIDYFAITQSTNSSIDDYSTLKQTLTNVLQITGLNNKSFFLALKYAHLLGFYIHDLNQAIDYLTNIIETPQILKETKAQGKIELADLYLLSGDLWESNLLYKQVELEYKHHPIGHEAKLKNAKLSFYKGEFLWAQSQLDILKAATSKLIANDAMELSLLISDNISWDSSLIELHLYAKADLLFFQNKYSDALITLDSINTLSSSHPILDEVLFKKAQIALKLNNITDAISYLNKIRNDYTNDILCDDALFQLAVIYEEKLQNNEEAQLIYKELLLNHPGSIYSATARKKYRTIRGDKIN